jgi:hypothetical protein
MSSGFDRGLGDWGTGGLGDWELIQISAFRLLTVAELRVRIYGMDC